jgi:hypothetical protein
LYSTLDVAKAAALRKLAAHTTVGDAAKIISEVVSGFRAAWERVVAAAIKEPQDMCVFVTRYEDTERFSVFFYPGKPDNPDLVRRFLSGDTGGGWRFGPDGPAQRIVAYTALYIIGADVSAALQRLGELASGRMG